MKLFILKADNSKEMNNISEELAQENYSAGKSLYFNEKEKVWKLCSTYVLFIHWIIPVYAYAYS